MQETQEETKMVKIKNAENVILLESTEINNRRIIIEQNIKLQ